MNDSEATARQDENGRWCILRTSPGRTLALVASLVASGLEVWTPTKITRRTLAPGRKNERRIEVAAPILPGFAFAHAAGLYELGQIEADDRLIYPSFSIFRHVGRIPLVGDRDVQGLRDQERADAAELQAIHHAETREAAEKIRIAAIKARDARNRAARMAEHERLRELRSERRAIEVGSDVTIADVPSFLGMSGIVERTDGRHAVIAFGGALTISVEAWQVSPAQVQKANPNTGIAA